jgi:hypothetical protein
MTEIDTGGDDPDTGGGWLPEGDGESTTERV